MSDPYAARPPAAANDSFPPTLKPYRQFSPEQALPLGHPHRHDSADDMHDAVDRDPAARVERRSDPIAPVTALRSRATADRDHVSDAGGTHAVIASGRTVWVEGQVGIDRDGELVGPGDCTRQAEQAMRNVAKILTRAGSDLDHVVKVMAFVTDARFRRPVTQVIDDWLRGLRVVTGAMIVVGLAEPEWLVEIEVVAVIPPEG